MEVHRREVKVEVEADVEESRANWRKEKFFRSSFFPFFLILTSFQVNLQSLNLRYTKWTSVSARQTKRQFTSPVFGGITTAATTKDLGRETFPKLFKLLVAAVAGESVLLFFCHSKLEPLSLISTGYVNKKDKHTCLNLIISLE